MQRLLIIGFEQAGHWILDGQHLRCNLTKFRTKENVLYAFVVDLEVKYIGKTTQQLYKRMYGYMKPGALQTTNIRGHESIRECLQSDAAVDVYVLPDNGLMHYGDFHINLAAGLEDSLIATIKPDWNGGKLSPKAIAAETEECDAAEFPVPFPASYSFEFRLQPTYFSRGFFNVAKEHSDKLGEDGQQIEIYCGDLPTPLTAVINRQSNGNGTPRILGGVQLRNWIQSVFTAGDSVLVDVYSPVSIRLSRAGIATNAN